jgi:hypothetical protein
MARNIMVAQKIDLLIDKYTSQPIRNDRVIKCRGI